MNAREKNRTTRTRRDASSRLPRRRHCFLFLAAPLSAPALRFARDSIVGGAFFGRRIDADDVEGRASFLSSSASIFVMCSRRNRIGPLGGGSLARASTPFCEIASAPRLHSSYAISLVRCINERHARSYPNSFNSLALSIASPSSASRTVRNNPRGISLGQHVFIDPRCRNVRSISRRNAARRMRSSSSSRVFGGIVGVALCVSARRRHSTRRTETSIHPSRHARHVASTSWRSRA